MQAKGIRMVAIIEFGSLTLPELIMDQHQSIDLTLSLKLIEVKLSSGFQKD